MSLAIHRLTFVGRRLQCRVCPLFDIILLAHRIIGAAVTDKHDCIVLGYVRFRNAFWAQYVVVWNRFRLCRLAPGPPRRAIIVRSEGVGCSGHHIWCPDFRLLVLIRASTLDVSSENVELVWFVLPSFHRIEPDFVCNCQCVYISFYHLSIRVMAQTRLF